MKRLTILALALLTFAATALADKPARTIRLANGLEVLMMPDQSSPLLSSLLIVHMGSGYETLATAGSTHLLEHMIFRGTTSRTQDEIYTSFDRMGAYYNAQTSKDYTMFILVVPSENAREAMEIQADMILNSTIPADTFDVEKGRVIAEIQQAFGRPSYEGEIAHLHDVYGKTSYGFPTLGSVPGIEALSVQTVRDFHDRWYVPNNMTLVLQGDLSYDQMKQYAEELYGDLPAAQLPDRAVSWPVGLEDWHRGQMIRHYGARDAGMLWMTLPAPRFDDADYPAYNALASFVDEALTTSLNGQGAPLVRYAYSSLNTTTDFSVLEITAAPLPGSDPELIQIRILEALQNLAKRDFSDEEVVREIDASRRQELFFGEQVQYGAFLLVPKLAIAPWGFWKTFDEQLSQVTEADVERAAGRWFTDPIYVTSAWLPESKESGGTGGITLGDVVVDTLDSGLIVIAREVQGAPVAGIHVIARGRALREGDQHRGWVDLLHRLLSEGYGNVDKVALQHTMDAIGMEMNAVDDSRIPMDDYRTTPEYSYIRVQTLSERWSEALDLLGNLLANGRIDPVSVENAAANLMPIAERSKTRLSSVVNGEFRKQLYGDNVLGQPVYGDGSTLVNVNPDSLAEFRSDVFGANNLVISVLAPAPTREIIEQVAHATKMLPLALEPVPPSPEAVTTSGETTVNGTGRQGYFATGFLFHDLSAEDYATLLVANSMISDRIYRDLGEKRGWAYGAGSSVTLREGWGSWTSAQGIPEEHLREAKKAVEDHREAVAKGRFEPEELEAARGDLRGRILRRYSSRINLAMGLGADYFTYGDPMMTWELFNKIAKVSADDVKRAAKKYLYKPKQEVTVYGSPVPAEKGAGMPSGMMGGMGR